MSTEEEEVRKASGQFYAAISRMVSGDAASLADVWSHSEAVTTMHPIGGRQVGWNEVRESFEQVAHISTDGQVKLEDQMIQVAGDMAYELGVERGQIKLGGHPVSIDHRATNIYRREAGAWKVFHHHTDMAPAMQDVLKRLQEKA
ncbi:nuclear transport factor 2 family protein [Polaromonas sp.]|uniref:YybH family protein n=1 Tax=Polaromonas sp. TaxID=1869339 RepID=UPI00286AD9E1|nr:nuclear transport factor 2 family protein [Polaromonas sp.]